MEIVLSFRISCMGLKTEQWGRCKMKKPTRRTVVMTAEEGILWAT